MNVIEIKNISVAYDETTVLENVNLNIKRGDFLALMGPNGAGKSTLLKTILNFIKPIGGEIKIKGKLYKEVRKKIAYVPQRGSVDWDFPITLFDVVEMGCYGRVGFLKKINKTEKKNVERVIEKVGLTEFKERQISKLSGGQQQRAFLARAILQNAEIYLMDEPFQGVDSKTEKAIVEILKELKKSGKTLIVVHHDLQTVTSYFDTVAFINKTIVAAGPVEDVFNEENIEKTYKKK
ncbi:metal ABC transporter ATP-binding protein [Fusobacterium gastrosuis]|uniref:metal ABC transporter ATP-binding protein n=1 Tax=Fusobacterium gastrosuis TaxID=1755100 RepID=UPI001F4FD5FD|nr:metal ABC transporter ATP-binding protein [Fusobacterium gastrosuis]MDY5306048.1 metal ABC transporter ATP-binding protein [Fusobacterium gastrosuis]